MSHARAGRFAGSVRWAVVPFTPGPPFRLYAGSENDPIVVSDTATLINAAQPAGQVRAATSPGERIYIKWCAECHASAGGPGTQVLELKYKGQVPAILHERPGLSAEFVKHTVRHGMGFMSPFRKTEISDAELAVLATYLSSVERASASKQAGPVK